jgi:hypothetical protein
MRLLPGLALVLTMAAPLARCGKVPDVADPHDGAGGPARSATAPAPPRSDSPADGRAGPAAPGAADAAAPGSPADFSARARPLLQERCSPCHFPGGSMHDRLPFDDEPTVRRLGEALFTRVRDAEGRALLEAFLASAPAGDR